MATSRSVNKVILVGNLTRDPAMKALPNGAFITTFGIATNKTWKTQDGKLQEKAVYHNIACWNKLAEISSEILQLGMLVYIEGEITTTDIDQNGVKYTRYEIRASDMKIMDSKGKKGVGKDQALKNASLLKDSDHHTAPTETAPMISELADIKIPEESSSNNEATEGTLF